MATQKKVLRVFSYLPNPRVWKALIAAEFCNVEVETLGAAPAELAHWLWDFDARELNDSEMTEQNPNARTGRRGFSARLYKTDAFLVAHPFGTVPAAFDPTGNVGIFESNSILRAVARSGDSDHGLYGTDAYSASRIDSFLDAGLVFARESQEYMLAMNNPSIALYDRMQAAFEFYLAGINNALTHFPYIAGDSLSIADIGYACDLAQFLRERTMADALHQIKRAPISAAAESAYPKALQHLTALMKRTEFAKYLTPLTPQPTETN
ncbi:MAG: glutathione S-transferase family protein [Pseudomonadota bacterium]